MKRILLLAVVTVFAYMPSFSQSDTTMKYYGKSGRETTKDSAVSYVKFAKQAGLWHGMEYYARATC